jgi:hypothetical protein
MNCILVFGSGWRSVRISRGSGLRGNLDCYAAWFRPVEIKGDPCDSESKCECSGNPNQAPFRPPWIWRATHRNNRRSGDGGNESVRFRFFVGAASEGNDLTTTNTAGEMREHLVALVRGERALGEGAEQLDIRMRTGLMAVMCGCGHETACSENA